MRDEPRSGMDGDLYIDAEGERYTTCPAATRGDPWWGATILSLGLVDRLRAEGRLPLTEVVRPAWADEIPRRRSWRWFWR